MKVFSLKQIYLVTLLSFASVGFATPLHDCARVGNLEMVRQLIRSGVNANETEEGWTALMYATYYGRIDVMRELVASGANIDRTTLHGWTALMYAAYYANVEAMQVLLLAGATLPLQEYIETFPALAQEQIQQWPQQQVNSMYWRPSFLSSNQQVALPLPLRLVYLPMFPRISSVVATFLFATRRQFQKGQLAFLPTELVWVILSFLNLGELYDAGKPLNKFNGPKSDKQGGDSGAIL